MTVVIGVLVAPGKDGDCQLGRMMGTVLFSSHIQHRRSCGSPRVGNAEAGGLAPAGCGIPWGCPVYCNYIADSDVMAWRCVVVSCFGDELEIGVRCFGEARIVSPLETS